ncbi:ABC transporter ATP-binding protein [Corynebacterium comes]|uniref:ABC transporter ATP-binding protein n=1 Tax=Corynebacterium comes TaxID=2675218 RepID=A0A6B8VWG3_9CORY|nr:ABC transporter ATP-binding protein [Corynebacterium comes]QGU05674.1 putative ABC transporter ATP-binding protein [Corynebacterium comes]
MELLRILVTRSRPFAGYVAAIVVLQTITTLATLYLPSLNAEIIDKGVSRGDVAYIWNRGGVMLVVAFVQVISAVIAVWFSARTAMGLGRDLRREVFTRVSSYSAEDMGRFGTPTLITRGTNDVQQVQMVYLMILNFMVATPIMSIGGIVMATREDAGLSWLVWVSVFVLAVIVSTLVVKLIPLFTGMQARLDRLNGILREQITGIRVVRAFTREDHETQRFDAANREITDISVRIGRIFVLMGPAITLILHLSTGAVLWFGGHRVDQGLVQVGSLTAFLQYLLQILVAVMMGTFMAMMLPRAIICARRIDEVLRTEASISEPAQPVTPQQLRGEIELLDVTFTYPGADQPVLSDVSFRAVPGEVTALIGATGSGKTTLLSLLPRLYRATEGSVLVDAVDVSDMSRADLVERVSIVPQKPYLFSGTVASNLRLGAPDATDEELREALDIAQAGFVHEHELGLEMPIAQGGTNVSGGQRQRLCIARTLVAKPKVYLFDDSFSALDLTTDAKLRAALIPRMADATMIVVAQRVASIMHADQILVMEAGRIVARGTHDHLLATSPTYREIVQSQLTTEEAR